eukprot:441725-Prymnesium_polylepis.1
MARAGSTRAQAATDTRGRVQDALRASGVAAERDDDLSSLAPSEVVGGADTLGHVTSVGHVTAIEWVDVMEVDP